MIKIIKDFITVEEENSILSHLKPSRIVRGFDRNIVIRYGSALPYSGPMKGKIPDWLDDICSRVNKGWSELEGYQGELDHVTINEYHKGQSIDWHIDSKTSGPIITVLSIESDAILGLKPPEELFTVERRTLLHMTGDDRWKKQHCIYQVKSHRWSIVFRKGTK